MSYDFVNFARAHGVEIDDLYPSDRIQRCGTVEHPRKKNGAYLWDGQRGGVIAWDGGCTWEWWDDPNKAEPTEAEKAAWAAKKEARRREQEKTWSEAARKASALIDAAKPGEHNYLHRKGLGDVKGLVLPSGELLVPMHNFKTGLVVGAQLIWWKEDERVFTKKYLYGSQPSGAALLIGPSSTDEIILVEGYATGLSVDKALRQMRLRASVLVCFNDTNLGVIAASTTGLGRRYIFADNDPPQLDPEKAKINPGMAGERAAKATGLNYCMSPVVGEDANDLHKRAGLMPLCNLIMQARRIK